MLNLMEGIIPEYDRKGVVRPYLNKFSFLFTNFHRSVVPQAHPSPA